MELRLKNQLMFAQNRINMARMKVLISGGGIAGNALAFWLSKLGHNVTVAEWFPTLRASGLQIDLRDHGIDVIKRMGLEKAFRAKIVPEQGFQIVDSSGKRRAYFPANRSGKGPQSFTTDWEIMRGDFCRLLYDATKTRAQYLFGTSVTSFEQKDNFVEVAFMTGRKDRYDLFVGADGLGSRTRKMMLGSDAADAFHPIGQCVAYFTIPKHMEAGEEYVATMYMAPGKRAAMTRRCNPRELQVYLGWPANSGPLKGVRRGDVKAEKDAFVEIYRGAGWQMDEILKGMMESDNFYCEHLGMIRLDSWSRGCVALVGDAAFCPTPTTGMGATSSIVGAYILAGEIGRHCGGVEASGNADADLGAALSAYEHKFKPFINQLQEGVLKSEGSWDFMPSSQLGITMLHWMASAASWLRLDTFASFMLKGDVRGWDLPEYGELLRD